VTPYLIGQIGGAFIGVAVANAMFGETLLQPSSHVRSGTPQLLSEFVAAFGLLLVIRGSSRLGAFGTAAAVAAYITAAYWFTASTSFANPAVTLGRAFTDTFTGIRPADAPGFVAAQLLGAGAAMYASRWLDPRVEREA
jgi:glycerol uptake facilitator-like aquaporin